MALNDLSGSWGFVHDPEDILPQFRPYFLKERLPGATLYCQSSDDNVVVLSFKGNKICAERKGFRRRPTPDFLWREHVRVVGTDVVATIGEICWHYHDHCYFYLLEQDGRQLRKRYFASELERI